MSVPLSRLRRHLVRLRRRRSFVRTGTLVATIGLMLLGGLAVHFMVDFQADLRPLPRAVLLTIVAGLSIWFGWKFAVDWRRSRETLTDVALGLERRHEGARDLVAALQFQSAEAADWGSPRLEEAVIGSVDDASSDLDPFADYSWSPLPVRAASLAGAIALLAVLALTFPRHSTAFLQRLTLADVPWPTRTTIAHVAVNGIPIDPASRGPVRVAAGSSVDFKATTAGATPTAGTVTLTASGGGQSSIALARVDNEPSASSPAFSGTLASLREPVTFTIRLGDADTRPRSIELLARPTLALDLLPTPPEYARSNAPAAPPAGVRTAYVLEGSSVAVRVRGVNKPLKSVSLAVTAPAVAKAAAYPLSRSSDGRTWTLAPPGTPFERIGEPIEFTITAIDDDGLSPAEPLAGAIRLRPDRPPRVAASSVTEQVLPTARPTLVFGASDDFGIASITARVAVNRADGTTEESTKELSIATPLAREHQGRESLNLAPFSLTKGDRVVVTVEATDGRGEIPGATASAEPLTFEITDRAGLLAALLEADEDGADRLDAVIRRELGIGEQR